MTKFIANNRTDASKADINLFFTITNCRIARSRALTHRIKIDQRARETFCSFRKIMTYRKIMTFCSYRKIMICYNRESYVHEGCSFQCEVIKEVVGLIYRKINNS